MELFKKTDGVYEYKSVHIYWSNWKFYLCLLPMFPVLFIFATLEKLCEVANLLANNINSWVTRERSEEWLQAYINIRRKMQEENGE